jgi:MinD-like ATPase involved in chromosome partitioning or flagellar assembly
MAGAERYVVLGLATARAEWFKEVGRWATAAAIPVEFVRCVSAEEARARLGGGRPFSALLVDAGVHGLDRDLVDTAVAAGAAVLVVDDDRATRDWIALGATAVLPGDFHRSELLEELHQHASAIDRPETLAARPPVPTEPGWGGQLVTVLGAGGTGTSTVAMAIAQAVGTDPRYRQLVLLADLCLDAELAMLHDARDVVPGLQELVEAHRTGFPSLAEIRSLVFDVPERDYHLLLGLRRHRDWAALRPRSVGATMESLLRSYRFVVADTDADLEGDAECGSIEVEERNTLARSAVRRADLVVVVGHPGVKGLHAMLRVIAAVVAHGVDASRILPVLNRSTRSRRRKAELAVAFGELARAVGPGIASPLHLPERARVDDVIREGAALPAALAQPLGSATLALLERLEPVVAAPATEPVPVRPGELGHLTGGEH